MKTAEEVLVKAGYDQSHWGIIIIKAEMEDGFGGHNDNNAGNWMSCACGKLDGHIERDAEDRPMDKKLQELGIGFYNSITSNQYLLAALTLIKIEKRSIELLRGDI